MAPMTDAASVLAAGVAASLAIVMISVATLHGWRGWLALKRQQLELGRGTGRSTQGRRTEISDLKERVRKLEAIANGAEP